MNYETTGRSVRERPRGRWSAGFEIGKGNELPVCKDKKKTFNKFEKKIIT
jgi:hypothetical protein